MYIYIYIPRGIRTGDPNVAVFNDHMCLRPRRHCDHFIIIIIYINLVIA
jgi:hypothetical protein